MPESSRHTNTHSTTTTTSTTKSKSAAAKATGAGSPKAPAAAPKRTAATAKSVASLPKTAAASPKATAESAKVAAAAAATTTAAPKTKATIPQTRSPLAKRKTAGAGAAVKSAAVDADKSQNVRYALRLGWQMAKVYNAPPPAHPDSDAAEALPEHLPGASEVGDYLAGQILLGEIKHDLAEIGKTVPIEPECSATIDELLKEGITPAQTQAGILSLFQSLLSDLAIADSQLETALGLGRMLADTMLLPNTKKLSTFDHAFDHYRLTNAYGWLGDLHRQLPDNASDAVSGTLKAWEEWVHTNREVLDQTNTKRALSAQGKLWRQLLCGDKLAEDLLQPEDYTAASERLVDRYRRLIWNFLRTWWMPIAGLLLAVAIIVGLTLWLAPDSATKIAALIATAAGALGVSWKTVAATVGRAANQSEKQLWDAEVRESVIMAAMRLPHPVVIAMPATWRVSARPRAEVGATSRN